MAPLPGLVVGGAVAEAAVGVVEPVGAVTGADGHRENRPALRRRGSAVGHGAAPLGCAARKNGTWRRLPNRRTPLPRLGDRGPDERQRSAEAQRVDCVRIVHWMRSALAHVGKGQQAVVAAALRQAFLQADEASAHQVWRQVADQLRPRWSKLAALMDESEHDVLAYTGFPAQHRAKLHSTDVLDKGLFAAGVSSVKPPRAAATPGPPHGRAAPSGWRSASAPPSSRCRRSGRRLARLSRSRPTTTRRQPGEPRGARPRAGGPCRPRRGSPPSGRRGSPADMPRMDRVGAEEFGSPFMPGALLSTSTLARGSTSARPRSNGHGPRLSLVRPWTGGPATRSIGGHRRR